MSAPERSGSPSDGDRPRRPRVVIAGHDLKFMASIPDFVHESGAELREDLWPNRAGPPTDESRDLLEWADTVMCEWCLGNAVFYSRNARPGQRIVVRFHRVEVETDFPAQVALDRVSAMVFVSDHVLDEAAARFGWPADRLAVIPNTVDRSALALPKLPGAEFNLGLVGFVPRRKRIDLALDVLERLREHDTRFRLLAKGSPPWDQDWVWRRGAERDYFERVYQRVDRSPLLRGAVTFEPFGAVPQFLQKVGFILSTSEHEGHQVGLAEGMASGAIPVVTARAGAREQYPADWVHRSTYDAARAIRATLRGGGLEAVRRRAVEFTARWSPEAIMPLWADALGLPASVPSGSSGLA